MNTIEVKVKTKRNRGRPWENIHPVEYKLAEWDNSIPFVLDTIKRVFEDEFIEGRYNFKDSYQGYYF